MDWVLRYFDACAAQLAAHDGAAREEVALLRSLASDTPSGQAGLLGDVYRAAVKAGVPPTNNPPEVYRLTHMVFFATDFGRIPVAVNRPAWLAALRYWMTECADNLDLVGELLICVSCLGLWDQSADKEWLALQAKLGALDRTPRSFAQNYHPILVGGVLAAVRE